MMVPWCLAATSHMVRNSSSVPKAGSVVMEIRSKWPSMLGVGFQPSRPPASFTGPVWTASMPTSLKASHSASEPSAPRKDWPGSTIMLIG